MRGPSFSVRMGLRAAAIGAVGAIATWLILTSHYYAHVLVLGGVALLLTFDLSRDISKATRAMARALAALVTDTSDSPAIEAPPEVNALIQNARNTLASREGRRLAEFHFLQAMVDAVPTVLIAVKEDGSIAARNGAALRFAKHDPRTLADFPVLGESAVSQLLGMAAGQREIIRLSDGQRMIASTAHFGTAGGNTMRLFALQPASHEFDAIETRAWRDLAAVLAHEMMNSITPIASLSESVRRLLQRKGAPSREATTAEVVSAIETISRRSQGLLDFVARYRRVEQLPQPIKRPIAVRPCLENVSSVMRAIFDARGIDCVTRTDPEDLSVAADASLLEQAMVNILHNAVEAMEGCSQPRVALVAFREDEAVVVQISDNGCGMDAATADDIFVPFFSTKPEGSGIGLTLARQIVVAHGGQLQVSSELGRGATFRLVFSDA